MKNKELIQIIESDADLYTSSDLANIIIYFNLLHYKLENKVLNKKNKSILYWFFLIGVPYIGIQDPTKPSYNLFYFWYFEYFKRSSITYNFLPNSEKEPKYKIDLWRNKK